jgi:type IV pilus assembly protein PilV
MKMPIDLANNQRGVMLLEALISILIFSIGILAIVGLQASSIKLASDSKYRSDASLLANRFIGQMWLANSSPSFVADFSTGGTQYLAWYNSSVAATLPVTGVSAPAVTIVQSSVAAASTVSSTVTIDIYWSVPGETANTTIVHRYNTRTEITN